MAKRKKKPSPVSVHNLERAQHRNEYLRKLKHLIVLLSSPEIYSLIPTSELERLYRLRHGNIKIDAAEGHKIPFVLLRDARWFITILHKREYEPVLPDGTQVTRGEYYLVAMTLMILQKRLKDNLFPGAARVLEALKPFFDFMASPEGEMASVNKQGTHLLTIGMMHSDLASNLFLLKPEIKNVPNRYPAIGFAHEVYAFQTEHIQVMWNGLIRPALRVGWGKADPAPHLEWCSIKSSELNLKHSKVKTFDVYIQSHALVRLKERLDCVATGMLHCNIYLSIISDLNVHKNHNGSYLIEYRIFGRKAGYLLGDIIDNKLVIRTFLFLTASGTPEGDRLMDSHGLVKEDKKFLGIDKLSTFIKSDIESDEKIKEIFINAGCESLFQLEGCEIREKGETYNKPISSYIASYLGLDEHEDLPGDEEK